MRELYDRYGYQEVVTPQIFKTDLFKTSGHYDNYLEHMYMLEIDEQEYGVKPMNCPSHAVMYSKSLYSYRDLPIRYADFGRLHRYELSGVTQGLTRVRSFSQDDAHIFCREDQIADEVNGFIDMLIESYGVFGFDDTRYVLSLRPEKRVGSDQQWDKAESALISVLGERALNHEEAEGEGAFYGPKIDMFVPDALGREWQLGTVQVDFNQPERFDLEYVNADGGRERPVMIHRAMLGSMERFLGRADRTPGRGVPGLAGARAGDDRAHCRSPSRLRRYRAQATGRGRDTGRRRRLQRPNERQDSPRPTTESALHAGCRRS